MIRAYTKPNAAWPVLIGDGPDEDASRDAAMDRRMREAIEHPAIVEWYCSVKLQLMLHLARRVLDSVHPGAGGDKDDYWASFEWGAGGITHLHIVLWKMFSVRLEKVARPDACGRVQARQADAVLETEANNRMADFYSPHICEVNANKVQAVHDRRSGHDGTSVPGHKEIGDRQRARLRKRCFTKSDRPDAEPHPCAIDWGGLADILYSCQNPSEEAAFDKRLDLISQLADWFPMHDPH